MELQELWSQRRSGRTDRRAGDKRPEDERDRSRIIHSASFRRLQGKTQVLGITESDFHRTRLTHSMEVAQIGRGLVLQLADRYREDAALSSALPPLSLIETVGFGHDLGHPPFGHGGEIALNFMMREAGGFEGNGQSLRLLTRLERHTPQFGLDLTRRAVLGILKYPAPYSQVRARELPALPQSLRSLQAKPWKPPKCYLDSEQDVVEWTLSPLTPSDRDAFSSLSTACTPLDHASTRFRSLDASIMELADDIAYGVHDFEDGVALRLIRRDHWREAAKHLDPTWARTYDLDAATLEEQLFGKERSLLRKLAIGALVNAFVSSAIVLRHGRFTSPLLDFHADLPKEARIFLDALTELTREKIIRTHNVQTLEYRGRYIVARLFEALASDWKSLLGPMFRRQAEAACDPSRSVCDYIAGMTDAYATRIYERLFVPRQGSVFEQL